MTQPSNLLISLSNLGHHVASFSLAFFDASAEEFFFIDTRSFMRGQDTGITGICKIPDGFACCIQSAEPRIILLNLNFEPTKEISIPQACDLHSIIEDSGSLIVAAARSNELFRIHYSEPEPRIEILWSHTTKDGQLHLNCPMRFDDRYYFSSHRNPKTVANDTAAPDDEHVAPGIVMDCASKQAILTGLQQPHTLIPYGDGALIASSFYGDLYFIPAERLRGGLPAVDIRTLEPMLNTTDYIRGISYDDNHLYLAGSARRIISRKQGAIKRYYDNPAATLGDPFFFSNIAIYDRKTLKQVTRYNTSYLAFDLYDLITLDYRHNNNYLLPKPEALRAQTYRNALTILETQSN